MMFAENAYAQAGESSAFSLVSLTPILLIFVIFYFLLFRPQQKKEKTRQSMLNSLKRGDKIVTSGGLVGAIHRIGDKELVLEIAEGVRINVIRSAVADVYSKTPELGKELEDKASGKSAHKGGEPTLTGHANAAVKKKPAAKSAKKK
jgi:preprotein translocase subunit YajC